MVNENINKKIIMLTHFVPTFKLIEKKYQNMGLHRTSWFASDLEHLIKHPIKIWICGHTHSIIECTVNDTPCMINAYGYGDENAYKNKENDKYFIVN